MMETRYEWPPSGRVFDENYAVRRRRRGLNLRRGPLSRTAHARTTQSTVASGILSQVLLVVMLGFD